VKKQIQNSVKYTRVKTWESLPREVKARESLKQLTKYTNYSSANSKNCISKHEWKTYVCNF